MWRIDAVGYGSVINGDGHDYYSYLMSIFIDKNLGHQNPDPWYIIQTPTGTVNVHLVGVSLLMLPFFLVGYTWAEFGGFPMTGISEPFQKMISMSALFYALMGFYFLRKLLLKLDYSEKQIAITLLLVFFGTHLLNYTITEPSMSHVYSFGLISAFMYTSYRVFNTYKTKYFIASALLLGLIVLVRPINLIILLIVPLWSVNWDEFKFRFSDILWNNKLKLFFAGLIFKLTVSIQSLVWFFQNGKLMQWTYKDNGMYFLNPSPLKMLFGFNAGLFVYTPLCLLLLFGLAPLYKENRYQFFALTGFIVFTIYLLSCHWAYTYFDGLSIRAFVDFLPVFALSGVALIKKIETVKWNKIGVPALTLAAAFNLLICYQYKAGIIPPSSMNFEKFKYVLFKTDTKYAGVIGGCNDLRPYSTNHPAPVYTYGNNYYQTIFFDYKNKSYGVEYKLPKIGVNTNKLFLKMNLQRREPVINNSENAIIVVSVKGANGKIKSNQNFKLNDTPSTTCCLWKRYYYQITIDGKMNPDDALVVYVWNRDKKEFYIDDFNVEVYNYNYNEQS